MSNQQTTLQNQSLTDAQILQRIEKEQSKLRYAFPALVARLRYQFWLLLLRETSILITLINNYDKIPAETPSKRIVGLFVKHSKLKKMIFALEKRLRKRIY